MTKRPVLVLGGGSDIGRAIARRFASEGYPIQLAARAPDTLEPDKQDLGIRHRVEVTLHRFDALDLAGAEAFFDGLPTVPGIVVSAVGLLGDQAEAERDPALAETIVRTNLVGPAIALEVAARRLSALDEPTTLIGISSVAGDRGRATNYWYGAAKAGFTAVLSGLRQKYARTRLHVLTVKPGFVATRMTEGMDLPKRLTAQPEEVAERTFKACVRRRHQIYVKPIWSPIMLIIRTISEFRFKRMSI